MTTSLEQAFELARASNKFENGRLVRAYELALDKRTQVGGYWVEVPTRRSWVRIEFSQRLMQVGKCECEDWYYHTNGVPSVNYWCKHRICAALIVRATQIETERQKYAEEAEENVEALVLAGEMVIS